MIFHVIYLYILYNMACEQVYIFSYEQNYVNNIIQSEIINEVLEIGTRDADFPEVRELGPGKVASGRLIGLGRRLLTLTKMSAFATKTNST